MVRGLTIAIDGFSSCGKSTLAKDLANKLGYAYIDSGAMYRAVTLYLLKNEINIDKDNHALFEALDHIAIRFTPDGQVLLNEVDISKAIRRPEVSAVVSEVAAISEVRRKLVILQQAYGVEGGIVMDGRDIGTVVFPQADLKIFLTADVDIRAKRRFDELQNRGTPMDLELVKKNLKHRDHIDSTREDSPLTQAPDAILLDNSHLDRVEQLNHVIRLVKTKLAQ